MRLLSLLHLPPHLRLDLRGVHHRLLTQHAHQVGDLHLGLRRLQQALFDHLLPLLLALIPPLRAQLLLLRFGEPHRLRALLRHLNGRVQRDGMLHIQVYLRT
jgi:hypothetical protein